jgi:hypothetical protein
MSASLHASFMAPVPSQFDLRRQGPMSRAPGSKPAAFRSIDKFDVPVRRRVQDGAAGSAVVKNIAIAHLERLVIFFDNRWVVVCCLIDLNRFVPGRIFKFSGLVRRKPLGHEKNPIGVCEHDLPILVRLVVEIAVRRPAPQTPASQTR